MAPRLQLQTLLEEILGSRNVYFQPPANLIMKYPCIRYSRSGADTRHADDIPYNHRWRYQVIVIDRDPDSNIPNRVAELPRCIFERHYAADGLNHDVFNLFF